MRIEVYEQPVSSVILFLSPAEASELRDGLDDYLRNVDDPGWHVHVPAEDFQTEITVTSDRGGVGT